MNKKIYPKISLAISIFFLMMFCTPAHARTIYVDDDGPADYDNIQAAIDAAVDGDEVVVAEGTYENVSIDGKSITLRSTDPTNPDVVAATIIDGGRREPAVYFSGAGDYPCWTLSGFTITNGYASSAGGVLCFESKPMIINNVITNNVGGNDSGGILCSNCPGGMIINNLITRNLGDDGNGGGITLWNSSLTIANCTITDNEGHYGGDSGILLYSSYAMVTNSIVWGNYEDQISCYGNSYAEVCYSNIEGGYAGKGNIDADPCFADAPNDDYHLLPSSPCIDAGDNTVVTVCTDLDGNARIVNGTVDMGAYEFPGPRETREFYVDDDATGANDGSSWGDAFNYLQNALAVAWSRDEIWVAQGIYKPDQGIGITPGNRTATFQLINGVTLKGGYAGAGAPDPNPRDIQLYETILTGDLAGNDGPDSANNGENSYRVVSAGGAVVVDGFTIAGGNANGPYPHGDGAGMSLSGYDSQPTVLHCTFSGNHADRLGGGLHGNAHTLTNCTFNGNSAWAGGGVYGSSEMLTNCTFSGNSAYRGGGMDGGATTLVNCTFSRNSAHIGGGTHSCDIGSGMTLINCRFSGNSAYEGGGMYNDESSPTLINCTFSGNSAGDNGGGMWNGDVGRYGSETSMTVTNCTFSENFASRYGGGIYNCPKDSPILTNCILWGNTDSDGSDESAQIHGGIPFVNYSCVQGWTGNLGGTGNIDSDPLLADPNNNNYHLKSQAGRYNPNAKTWVQDPNTSPCIDTGDPKSPIGHEPFPNGGIINMGAYGGTAEASKSYFGEPVCETIIAGDINGDCKVNFLDFRLMAAHWLRDENR